MKILKLLAIAAVSLTLGACSYVPSGHVGVKVKMYGGDKGVDTQELPPGRYWIGWNEELHLFPTFTQNACWTKGADPTCGSPNDESIGFQTIEGMTVSADIGMSYSVDTSKVSELFQKYRKGINEITDVYLRNHVRDALVTFASTKSVEDVYGRGKVEIMNQVEKEVRSQVAPLGLKIENIYWIGEIRLPPKVIDSLNAKIQAVQMTQQRQNEVAQSKAEADKKIEEARGQAESIMLVAKSQAEANIILSKSLTKELVEYKAIERWDGVLPKVSGGATPFISMDLKDKLK